MNCAYSNETICGMNSFQRLGYQLTSQTPLGIDLWVLMLIGTSIILMYSYLVLKPIFDKKDSNEGVGEK